MKHLELLTARLGRSVQESVHYSRYNAPMIGVLGVITFPLYHYVWWLIIPQPYENLWLRMIGVVICVPLIFAAQWPKAMQRYFATYWILFLLYTLPFFFTYMLLRNDLSLIWSMSTMAALFFLVLAVYDWLLVILLTLAGSLLGWAGLLLTTDVQDINTLTTLYFQQLPIYAFVVIGGSIFNYNAQLVKEEKLNAHAAVGRNIAHELRTPLLGMKAATSGLVHYLPQLVDGHKAAMDAGLPVKPIRGTRLDKLRHAAERIDEEIDYSNTIIDMLLLSAGQTTIKQDSFSWHSINDTIERALDRFPFKSDRERHLVHWERGDDFAYYGSDLLVTHVLFNLIKNALHSVLSAGKGTIRIGTGRSRRYNRLIVMDTGPGIDQARIRQIFDYFYSSKTLDQGAGLGLSFCKLVMESLQGKIHCESRLNEYTLFEMSFPREQ
ncbi:HAMP domain-containing histidine kinase [Alcanivorax sp. JB21]|uniref:sensor histidine kinase n=1 Tax=Alcanivorax limicola TaxID=2874102 RepID=UPI001CC17822|nr:HAMP domain-containing sensor histidine kinase [Alcanivorax limicola]MBZ2190166.1 HAMP domain-containing histidine kinase [Alcanivorax limicola]